MSDLVGNPEDRFSRVAAHLYQPFLCQFYFILMVNDTFQDDRTLGSGKE